MPSYCLTTALLLPYYCHTTTILLLYHCLTSALLLLYYCLTTALLLPYYCLTTAILLPYFCHTSALLLPYYCHNIASLLPSCCLTIALTISLTTALLQYVQEFFSQITIVTCYIKWVKTAWTDSNALLLPSYCLNTYWHNYFLATVLLLPYYSPKSHEHKPYT